MEKCVICVHNENYNLRWLNYRFKLKSCSGFEIQIAGTHMSVCCLFLLLQARPEEISESETEPTRPTRDNIAACREARPVQSMTLDGE